MNADLTIRWDGPGGSDYVKTIQLTAPGIDLDAEDYDTESGHGIVNVICYDNPDIENASESDILRIIAVNAHHFVMLDMTWTEEDMAEKRKRQEEATLKEKEAAAAYQGANSVIQSPRIGR